MGARPVALEGHAGHPMLFEDPVNGRTLAGALVGALQEQVEPDRPGRGVPGGPGG